MAETMITWLGLWFLGMILAYGVLMRVAADERKGPIVLNPEKSFEKFPANWYVEFDKEWNDIIRIRRGTIRRVLSLIPGSWLIALAYMMTEKIRFRWRFDKLPDKESFRSLVNMTRLMDPEWQDSNLKMIKEIINEKHKAKNN